MGKPEKSSKRINYDDILRKVKKLERKLRKKKRRSSSSTTSESDHYEVNDGFLPDEDLPFENMDEEPYDEHTQYLTPDQLDHNEPTGIEPSTSKSVPTPLNADNDPPLLDPETLLLLGEDPNIKKLFGPNLHKDIASRWTNILINGLSKDTQLDLVKQYLPAENCPNMKAPKLNLEIKAALSELYVKKDVYSQSKQTQIASSLAAVGQVLDWALTSKNIVPPEVIKQLGDAGRLLCDSHYRESQSRRYMALNALNKNIRDTVKNTNIDANLFGSDLSEHIKSSKAISKTGSEMRPSTSRPPQYKEPVVTHTQPYRGALNSRGTSRAAAADPRPTPVLRRPPRDRRRQDMSSTRGRRFNGYSRQQTRRR